MLLKLSGGRRPGIFVPAVDHETDSIVHSTLEGTTTVVLDGGESMNLVLVSPPNLEESDAESEITATVKWEFVQPLLWRGKRTIVARIQKRTCGHLIERKSRE